MAATVRRVQPWRHATLPCYRLRGWRRWLMWWVFGPVLLAGLVLAAGTGAGEATAGLVLLVVAAAMLAGWEWICRRTTLEVSATGLRLRQLGYTLETPWTNVAGFHAQPAQEGFVLVQALDTPGARRLAGADGLAGLHGGDAAAWIARCRFIPIEAFAWHLRHGTLAADVSALAPQLAPALRTAQEPPPPVTPAQRRRHRVIGWSIGMLVVASLVLAWAAPAATGRAVDIGYALAMPLVALHAAVTTWQFARGRRWGLAALMAAWTLLSLGGCAVMWQHLG